MIKKNCQLLISRCQHFMYGRLQGSHSLSDKAGQLPQYLQKCLYLHTHTV